MCALGSARLFFDLDPFRGTANGQRLDQLPGGREFKQLDRTITLLDKCGEALDPVSGIVVIEVLDPAHSGRMDVTTDNSFGLRIGSKVHHRLLKTTDEVHDILHAALHIGTQRPMTVTDQLSEKIDRAIELQKQGVTDIANMSEPSEVLDDVVELMSVGHEQLPPIDRRVKGTRLNVDIGIITGEIGDPFIMIARNVDNLGSFAPFAEDFLDHVAVLLGPVDPSLHRPDVDQVTDDIKRVALKCSEKSQQGRCLGPTGSQMNIGDPNAPVVDEVFFGHKMLCRSSSQILQGTLCHNFATLGGHC